LQVAQQTGTSTEFCAEAGFDASPSIEARGAAKNVFRRVRRIGFILAFIT